MKIKNLASAAAVATATNGGVTVSSVLDTKITNVGGPQSRLAVIAQLLTVNTSPSVVFSVEWSADGTNFFAADTTPDAFAAQTAVGGKAASFNLKGRYARVKATCTGAGASATFSVDVVSS